MTSLQVLLWCPIVAFFSGLPGLLPGARGEGVSLSARPVRNSAIAGIPVVVGLTYRNETSRDVLAQELVDPYMVFVRWHWKSPAGDSYRVTEKDLHYAVTPDPADPRPLTLGPGQEKIWYFMVPTPKSFGTQRKWTLEVTVTESTPMRSRLTKTTRSMDFSCRNLKGVSVLNEFESSLLQAAILRPGSSLLSAKQLQQVERSHAKGDLVATLVLFSTAVGKKHHIWKYWTKLDGAPAEAKCLRNCLMWTASGQRRWTLPEEERQKLLEAIADVDGPFIAELRKNLQQRPTRKGVGYSETPKRGRESLSLGVSPVLGNSGDTILILRGIKKGGGHATLIQESSMSPFLARLETTGQAGLRQAPRLAGFVLLQQGPGASGDVASVDARQGQRRAAVRPRGRGSRGEFHYGSIHAGAGASARPVV